MDPWLLKILERLKKARDAAELQSILDDLEDLYDAFSGPGAEVVDQLIAEAQRRLAELDAGG
ncbi:MAG: hypothetical protein ACK4TK_01640 [Thiobacillaceae bacterium]